MLKFIKNASVASLLLLVPTLFKPDAAQAQPVFNAFTRTCGNIHYSHNNTQFGNVNAPTLLVADCIGRSGRVQTTALPLYKFISNIDGQLYWQLNGDYHASCVASNIVVHNTYTTLYAICHAIDFELFKGSEIILDEHINNIDGRLEWIYP